MACLRFTSASASAARWAVRAAAATALHSLTSRRSPTRSCTHPHHTNNKKNSPDRPPLTRPDVYRRDQGAARRVHSEGRARAWPVECSWEGQRVLMGSPGEYKRVHTEAQTDGAGSGRVGQGGGA